MIGVVVPAHNEAACLGACLDALRVAAAHSGLLGEPVAIAVVLDSCTDGSAVVVAGHQAHALHTTARNVGMGRALGADHLLAKGARWLAFTDADTLVSPEWLVQQLALEADAVCGTIAVADWSHLGDDGEFLREHFARTYTDADGHQHIHGANLGVSSAAYIRAGGFKPLACSEDVDLVRALESTGATVAWSAAPRVHTSSRLQACAAGGFGDTLSAVLTGGRLQAEALKVRY